MAAQDIINWLNSKNGQVTTPAEVAQFKADLRIQLTPLSLEVANQKSNAITLLYSGAMGKGEPRNGPIQYWQVAEATGNSSNGAVRTIGQTDLGKFLNSFEFAGN